MKRVLSKSSEKAGRSTARLYFDFPQLIPFEDFLVENLKINLKVSPQANGLYAKIIVSGDIQRIILPFGDSGSRKHELWKHTCIEFFLKRPDSPSYTEFNLSPSENWNAYSFNSWRDGMMDARVEFSPTIDHARLTDELIFETLIPWPDQEEGEWLLGPAVILETDSGIIHWALSHPTAAPDFHREGHFISLE
jgi:hypothetical protein